MMEKIKNAMKNGLVKGSCDSLGATSVGSSSERSRSGSDEARTATARAGRAWRAVGGARAAARRPPPSPRAGRTSPSCCLRRVDGVRATAIVAFATAIQHLARIDHINHNFLNCAANERTEGCATSAVPC